MSLGRTPTQQTLSTSTVGFCHHQLPANSIYRYLYENSALLFPDESFADLFKELGRESIPPRIVAVVMILQRLTGASDREAVSEFTFNMLWKYAAGGLPFDYPGFVHTVLVRMRARLRNSERPRRIFDVVLDVAKAGGLVGRKRVLDSTPIYDAVATQDTVTLIRSAIRGVLRQAGKQLAEELREVLERDDDYVKAGKPVCDWNDADAREELIDALCKDAGVVLGVLHDRDLSESVRQAAELLATVVDQDTEVGEDGRFRIARKVAKQRVLSTVDPEARHGHKSKSRKFDGYKQHISVEPDSEIITATAVTPGNASDVSVARELIEEFLADNTSGDATDDASENLARPHSGGERDEVQTARESVEVTSGDNEQGGQDGQEKAPSDGREVPDMPGYGAEETVVSQPQDGTDDDYGHDSSTGNESISEGPAEIYGDAAYGEASFIEECKNNGLETYLKVQPASAKKGMFSKDDFSVDLERGEVTCPGERTVPIRRREDGSGHARFGVACRQCPLRERCTSSSRGRLVQIHAKEHILQEERKKQKTQPEWQARYVSTRPKIERKIGHGKRRYHGGRRARMRGSRRIGDDFAHLAAGLNLQRLAKLGVRPPAKGMSHLYQSSTGSPTDSASGQSVWVG